MPNAVYSPISTHVDPEGSPPEKKKPLLPSFFSWFLSLACRHLILSSIIISIILTGTVAGVVNLSYILDKQDQYLQIPPDRNGASGVVGPSWVLTDDVSQIALVGRGANFDEAGQVLTIQWEILGCGAYRLQTYQPPTRILEAAGCSSLDRAVDVHFNQWVYIQCRCPLFTY